MRFFFSMFLHSMIQGTVRGTYFIGILHNMYNTHICTGGYI